MTELIKIQQEIDTELANKEVMNTLVATTFKGLTPANVRQACVEGVMRGYTFRDFLEKNIYAIPFREGYSLVTSIDHARKLGMRSGVCGKSAPTYEQNEKQIISCTITVKRKVGEYVGDYSATVYFSEYSTGRNLWVTKPRTMLAKVAEMHALRMACPEELSQAYVEEEREAEIVHATKEVSVVDYESKLKAVKSLDELKVVWSSLPVEAKTALTTLKDELKKQYAN